jgi:hypothetical protein
MYCTYYSQNIFVANSLFFLEKFAKNFHNCIQHENMLKIFLLSYFEYCQINCLDIFMDDQHLNNIMKFEKQIIAMRWGLWINCECFTFFLA